MGRKYYLTDFSVENNYNAGSKAVSDVNTILEKNGYTPLFVGYGGRKTYIGKLLVCLYCLITLPFKIKRNDVIFIQYPIYIIEPLRSLCNKIILHKKCKVEILIHDLNSYRYKDWHEDKILFKGDIIICHTPRMKKFLINIGVDEYKIKIIYLFDYLTRSNNIHPTTYGNEIIFAGNLSKSGFISNLPNVADLKFLLYGLPQMNFNKESNIEYVGRFNPNDITDILGDWGLVWDGDSVDTCNGPLGKYLAINSSHKISLYIVAKKPVIIWEESSLRDFIVNNHLGIAVKSLSQIRGEIASISEDDKNEMSKSLTIYSTLLKQGEMLNSIIRAINE